MVLGNWQGEYKSPNNLHLIVDSVYELVILQYLIQISNGCKSVHPSTSSLRLGLFSLPIVHKAIKGLCDKNYIQKINRPAPLANEYIINDVDINFAINNRAPARKRKYTPEQIEAMNLRQQSQNPELTIKGATINGGAFFDGQELKQDAGILARQSFVKQQNDDMDNLREKVMRENKK